MRKTDGKAEQTHAKTSGRAGRARSPMRAAVTVSPEFQDPHGLVGQTNRLETAIGREVREFRRQLDMTVAELSKQAKLSAGMLSKIENGRVSASLESLEALARALNVPLTSFFATYEERRDFFQRLVAKALP